MNILENENETRKHILRVIYNLQICIEELSKRARKHDLSKLEEPELSGFTKVLPKLKQTTYGSPEYNQLLKELELTLTHHYSYNDHHPEHQNQGVDGMNLFSLVEMFCDWLAATQRHQDGDFMKSLIHNQERFRMSPQLVKIFENTYKKYFPTKE